MKLNKIFYLLLCLVLPLAFTACSSDDDEETHTDASQYVLGTYEGYILDENEEVIAEDGVITITKLDTENTQAVTLNISSATLGLGEDVPLNAAKAGNQYLLGSASNNASTRNTGAVIEGDDITVYFYTNSKHTKLNATTSHKKCLLIGKRVSFGQ